MHVVQHFLGAFGPDFIVPAVAEEADADDDVACEGEAFLRFQELVFEARAAAEGYDGVFAGHEVRVIVWFLIRSKEVPVL